MLHPCSPSMLKRNDSCWEFWGPFKMLPTRNLMKPQLETLGTGWEAGMEKRGLKDPPAPT